MAVERVHRTVYQWGTGPVTKGRETRYHQSLDMRQMVREERCDQRVREDIGCYVTNRLNLKKGKGCYRCQDAKYCSLGLHDRKDIDYHERLPTGEISEDILQPQTQPMAKATKEHRTVYPLGTGPKGNNSDSKKTELIYYNDGDFRQLITKDACSRCIERKVACFVTMEIGSNRRSCCSCGAKSSAASKCSLSTAARRDIIYHELLPSGEPSEDALVPRVAYGSREAIIARQSYGDGLISRIPDHVPTGPRVLLRHKDTGSITAQATTATTQAVVTPSVASGSTSAPDLTLRRCKLTPSRLRQMWAERALAERLDPASASAERDQAPGPKSISPAPATIGFTQSSDSSASSSPPSSVIELEPTVPIAASKSSRVTTLSTDPATLDRDVSPESSSSPPRVSSEIVFHLIAINNSKDPRAHEASTLDFGQRQMTVQVHSDQYDGPDFDYGPETRDSAVQRGPEADEQSTSGDEESEFAGTENEKILEEIEDMEKENVRMNGQIWRNQLKASAKVMRELKGDVAYEKDFGRELQKKWREQQAHNEEKEWQLAKSEDLNIAMSADCQA